MVDDHAPRMSSHGYDRCIESAASASSADEIASLRAEVTRRWGGDPRANDLIEVLYAHETALASGEMAPCYGGVTAGLTEATRVAPRSLRSWSEAR
jgi:hypothetical protein